MKILKLKSILFGLMAVFAFTALLTSCEKDTLNNLDEEVALQNAEEGFEENFIKSFEQVEEENIEKRGCRKLTWKSKPNGIYRGQNYMKASYCIDRPGIVVAQVFNCNWQPIGQHWYYINSGSGTKSFKPSGDAFGNKRCYNENNYVQIKLLDRNWNEIASKLSTTVKGK